MPLKAHQGTELMLAGFHVPHADVIHRSWPAGLIEGSIALRISALPILTVGTVELADSSYLLLGGWLIL